AADFAGGLGGGDPAHRRCGMESALAQLGMARAADRNIRLIAGNERFDQRCSACTLLIGQREHHRHDHAARMNGALAETVIELDAVGARAAEEGGIEEIGPARAPGYRNGASWAHSLDHGLGLAGYRPTGACDHHPHRIEQMAARIMAYLLAQCRVAKRADKTD